MASEINIDDIPSAAPARAQAQEIDLGQVPSVNIDDIPSAKPSLMDKLKSMAPHAADQAFRKMFHLPNGLKDVESAGKVINYPFNVLGTAGLSGIKHVTSGEGLGEGRDIKSALAMNGKSAPEVLQKDFGMGKLGAYGVGIPYEVALQLLAGGGAKKLLSLADESEIGQSVMGKLKGYMRGAPSTSTEVAPSLVPEGEITGDGGSLLDSLTRPLANKMDSSARGLYHNAFRKVDTNFNKFKGANTIGEHPFSDLAYDKEFLQSGSTPLQMEEQAANYRDNVLGPQYNDIIDTEPVASQRSKLSGLLSKDTMDRLRDSATRAPSRPGAMAAVRMLNKDIKTGTTYPFSQAFDKGQRSPRQLLDLAKDYSEMARGKAGMPGDIMAKGATESSYKDSLMNMAQDMRDRVQSLAEQASPGSRAKIQDLNREYQILKTADPSLRQAMMVENRKLPMTQADVVSGGLGLAEMVAKKDPLWATIFALKRGGKMLNSPTGAVSVGNKLKSASKSNAWDVILRQGILDKNQNEEQ